MIYKTFYTTATRRKKDDSMYREEVKMTYTAMQVENMDDVRTISDLEVMLIINEHYRMKAAYAERILYYHGEK